MEEEYVYTDGDILVKPYIFQRIEKLKLINELNEHAKLYISGIISDEIVDKYVESTSPYESIAVALKDDQGNIIDLFRGIVTNVGINAIDNVRTLEIEALSKTFLMDIQKRSRSFQNENNSYEDAIRMVNSQYRDIQFIDNATYGAKIDKLLVQYKETDWQFIKRIVSHFNCAVVPACELEGIKYTLGSAENNKYFNINEFNYSIKKGLQEYNIKYANDGYDLSEVDLINYEITTNKIMTLYNDVAFKGRKLSVYRCEIELVNGILLNKYILRDINGMKVRKNYNNNITGVSLQGRVLAAEKDKVKVSLEIDGSPTTREGARWFEFATIFSSPSGAGWYCMPEIEDVVRLYFPDNEEKHAYVISSMHYQSSNPNKRSDPSVKSIGTKYGKEIVMSPGSVEIIGNGNLLMRLTDDGGIEVNSNKNIVLDAGGDISINGGGKVSIKGKEGVNLTQSGANVVIQDDVTMSGGKVNIQS
ncbi:phage tail protein [Clostridium botulinum]|nr:phage tail protein [Clostridium botulinum]